MTIKEIRQITNLSQKKFCEKYGIPLQTLCKWEQGYRTCPDYVVELLEFRVREDLKMDTKEILEKILSRIESEVFETLSDCGDDWFTADKVSQIMDIVSEYIKKCEQEQ